tara:strand:- start:175 stop:393 length:219 start_codon:yes stop_codon:yes gene_type:complete
MILTNKSILNFDQLKKLYRVLSLSVIFTLFIGCEDDPILEPQGDKDEGGSYAKISLPAKNDKVDKKKNPKIY